MVEDGCLRQRAKFLDTFPETSLSVSSNRRYGGGRLLETESEVSGNVSSSSRCKYFYYVGSYYSARRVPESQLPQQAEGGGRRAAQQKGNDWGYYVYVCKHTSFQFYTQ